MSDEEKKDFWVLTTEETRTLKVSFDHPVSRREAISIFNEGHTHWFDVVDDDGLSSWAVEAV